MGSGSKRLHIKRRYYCSCGAAVARIFAQHITYVQPFICRQTCVRRWIPVVRSLQPCRREALYDSDPTLIFLRLLTGLRTSIRHTRQQDSAKMKLTQFSMNIPMAPVYHRRVIFRNKICGWGDASFFEKNHSGK